MPAPCRRVAEAGRQSPLWRPARTPAPLPGGVGCRAALLRRPGPMAFSAGASAPAFSAGHLRLAAGKEEENVAQHGNAHPQLTWRGDWTAYQYFRGKQQQQTPWRCWHERSGGSSSSRATAEIPAGQQAPWALPVSASHRPAPPGISLRQPAVVPYLLPERQRQRHRLTARCFSSKLRHARRLWGQGQQR